MGFNSAFKGLKLLNTPRNGRLNNLNDPVLNVLTQNSSYVSTGLQQRNAPSSHLAARLSNRVIPDIETQEVIFLLHIGEAVVHSSSQTAAVCTQGFVASLSPSR
jgi:hypothetical protein